MVNIKLKHNDFSATEALRYGVMELQKEHIESASLDARILLEYVLDVTREQMLLVMDKLLTQEQEVHYLDLIRQRAERRPVAQLIGQREFWGLEFNVSEATLDPRPDSETLIEALLERQPDREAPLNILDLGTGTGCLMLSLLSEYKNARGTAVDISPDALAVAKENAQCLGLEGRATFIESNWDAQVDGQFDIIISNPPYIPSGVISTLLPEVYKYEPHLALDGGEDGMDCYRAIVPRLAILLAVGGVAAFEIGIGQLRALESIVEESGLIVAGIRKDIGGIPRCVLVTRSIL